MEGLLLAVRDVALNKGPVGAALHAATAAAAADEEVGQVQALLASLGAAAAGADHAAVAAAEQAAAGGSSRHKPVGSSKSSAAGQLLLSELEANKSRQEFTQVGAVQSICGRQACVLLLNCGVESGSLLLNQTNVAVVVGYGMTVPYSNRLCCEPRLDC